MTLKEMENDLATTLREQLAYVKLADGYSELASLPDADWHSSRVMRLKALEARKNAESCGKLAEVIRKRINEI